ncbi:MAG TPA: hypothetical protein VH912_25300 [Streptosporangiaceae bacterium]|jgi:hypothetical protein
MTNSQGSASERQINTRSLVVGGVLIGLGGVVGMAGVVLAGSTLVAAVRRRVQQMEVPPRELAKAKWVQAKSAAAAGVGAWQNNGTTRQHAPTG